MKTLNDVLLHVADCETTGFDRSAGADLVEVAVVEVSGGRVRTILLDTLCLPGHPIPPEVSAVHHITDDMLSDVALTADGARSLFAVEVQNSVCVAHNAAFDRTFLDTNSAFQWLCTYRLASHLLPDAPGHSNQVLRYYCGLKIPARFDIGPLTAMHRALPDTVVTAHLLVHLIGLLPKGWDTPVQEALDLCWSPIIQTKIRFGKHAGSRWADVPKDYLRWMLRQDPKDWDPDTYATAKHYAGVRA